MSDSAKHELKYVGQSIVRVDAADKAHGTAKYINDIEFPGLLIGYTIRSTRQRARIVKMDVPAFPPGVTFVTVDDIPGENYVALFNKDQPLLAKGIVNYIGEPIALLAGADANLLPEIAAQIRIGYEDLPAIDSLEDAISGQFVPIYGSDNVFKSYSYIKGEPDKVLAESAFVFEEIFRTGYQEQAYLETQGVVAFPYQDGVKIIGSMQCPFYVQKGLASALKLDPEKIVVEQSVTGGAFGGKEEFPSLIAGHAALLALKSGQPVKITYDRHEDISVTTKRHPSKSMRRIGFDKDFNITAMEIDFVLNGGAHSTLSQVVLARGALSAPGAYKSANIRLLSRAVATNQVPSGAFRGFGAPQAFFAIETQINHSAYRLNIDPYFLRKKNILRLGDRTATGQLLKESVGLEKALDTVVKRTDFVKKYKQYQNRPKNSQKLKGIGLSVFFHGCGFTGKGEELIRATASVDYSNETGALIRIATVEMGQGMNTVMRQIAADALALPIERVKVNIPNTAEVPNSGPTVASRTTMIVGGLVARCCADLLSQVGATAEKHDFVEKAKLSSSKILSATRDYRVPKNVVWDDDKFIGDAYPIYSWAAAVVEVAVDPITFEVTVEKITAAHDIGKAINPVLVEGQIEGGSLQGLGYASIEVMTETNGRLNQASFTDYIIPTTLDTPEIDTIILEENYSRGPFGAKGVGEQPLVGIPAAYVGAVENALGVEFHEIPLTPEIIHRRVFSPQSTQRTQR
ncbi:MAG: xanthine dehydrogenase family protein molybdopterin-binding subunit [Candidatus Marinimicrobia bacterium]|jgi:CO/xanthine dehydrogenase Mo-binding subunit|nr:xanthine dehydrogenase family protein molybdopterin-binding subunit [Candidatus Neomarinimicrobiota bacterium]MDD5062903.1 xanthine dehydrogenase family protein molybdopterin-binding subunit [Candidatus Neomarinimicrobiota bacterium]